MKKRKERMMSEREITDDELIDAEGWFVGLLEGETRQYYYDNLLTRANRVCNYARKLREENIVLKAKVVDQDNECNRLLDQCFELENVKRQLEDQRLISWGLAHGFITYNDYLSNWVFREKQCDFICTQDWKVEEITLTDEARAILQKAKEEAE